MNRVLDRTWDLARFLLQEGELVLHEELFVGIRENIGGRMHEFANLRHEP